MVPEGWERIKLGKLLDFQNGVNTEAANYGRGSKFVNVMDIFENRFLMQDRIRGTVTVTPRQDVAYALRRGDILFNRTSETFDEIALSSVYLDDAHAIFGGFVIRGRPRNGKLSPEFSGYCFSSDDVRREIIRRGQGAIRANIGQGDLGDVSLLLPPLSEQKKIAEILSTWDRAIEITEKLLANAEAQKRALMQQLLAGKRRLAKFKSTPWMEAPIASIATEVSERNRDGRDWPVISCSKTLGFVNSIEYFKKQVFSDERSGYKIIRRGQIGYPSNHVEEGSIGLQNLHDVALVSPIYTVFETSPAMDSTFLFHVLKTDHYRQVFAAATNASVDRRGSLRWKAFSGIKVPVPTLDEQRAINEALGDAIQEVRTCVAQLSSLRAEKSALMQQLLTGKRRVSL